MRRCEGFDTREDKHVAIKNPAMQIAGFFFVRLRNVCEGAKQTQFTDGSLCAGTFLGIAPGVFCGDC